MAAIQIWLVKKKKKKGPQEKKGSFKKSFIGKQSWVSMEIMIKPLSLTLCRSNLN